MNYFKKYFVISLVALSLLFSVSCSSNKKELKCGTYNSESKDISVTINEDSTAVFHVDDAEAFKESYSEFLISQCRQYIPDEDLLNENIEAIEKIDINDYVNKQVELTYTDATESEGFYYIESPEYYCIDAYGIEVHFYITLLYYPSTQELMLAGNVFNDPEGMYLLVLEK